MWNTQLICAIGPVVLLLAFSSADGSPTIISSLGVHGNTAFTDREVITWLVTKPSRVFSESVLNNDLRVIGDNYRRHGYLSSRIDSVRKAFASDSSSVDIDLFIHEGDQTIIGAISVKGQQQLSEHEILRRFDLKPGNPLDESVLEGDIDALLAWYERLGYPFARCGIARMTARPGEGTDTLDVVLKVEEDKRITIDEIRVTGNKDTDPAVVVRETRLAMGETFNPVKIDAIKQRLKRLNVFADVSDPELYVRREKSGLLIKVQEGNTNTFDGVIGYIPENAAGQAGYLTGLVSISMRNLFGTGRKLSFQWQREDRNSQELSFRYLEPWIFNLPINVGGGFLQRQQDTSYVRRAVDLKGELMISEELSLGLLFGSESIIPSADSSINRVFRSSTITVGAELQYDTRDDIYSPTSGAHYRTDYRYGKKTTSNVPGNLEGQVAPRAIVQRLTLDLDFFLSTFTHQVVP
jgi:outer membrane protein insertion porin family